MDGVVQSKLVPCKKRAGKVVSGDISLRNRRLGWSLLAELVGADN
jgi:hypothetical protein